MVAAGSVEISGQHVADRGPEDLGQRQRPDGEVGAAQPERGEADGSANSGRDRGARRPWRRRMGTPPIQSVRVDQSAEAEEGRVPQVHLAGVARDDVPALRRA